MVTRAPNLRGEARIELRQRMRQAYEAGATVVQVAERFGRSYGTTHKLLTEAGTRMRRQGGGRRGD